MSMIGSCICCLIIIGIALGVYFYYYGSDEDIQKVKDVIPDNLEDLFGRNDPFAGVNNTKAWPNNGKGLELTILNALDTRWYPYFELAVSQWENGTPDSLTLRTSVRSPDSACTAVSGFMKVCNGDYGDTNWKGVNQIFVDDSGKIYTSSAMMNEFYMKPSSGNDDEKQYTMCHEMGHGFGLPHSDENFYNRDLGNCMDYTARPGMNKQPDETNFALLAQVYGVVNGGNGKNSTSMVTSGSIVGGTNAKESSLTVNSQDPNLTFNDGEKNNGNRHRQLRQGQRDDLQEEILQKRDTTNVDYVETTPAWILDASKEIHSYLLSRTSSPDSLTSIVADDVTEEMLPSGLRRVLIHRNDYGEAHMFHIGNGHTVHVNLLR